MFCTMWVIAVLNADCWTGADLLTLVVSTVDAKILIDAMSVKVEVDFDSFVANELRHYRDQTIAGLQSTIVDVLIT